MAGLVQFGPRAGDSGLSILSSMNVRFLVVDPLGRRTGFDATTGRDTTGIPLSSYGVQPIGEPGGRGAEVTRKFVASFGTGVALLEGPYDISVFGDKAGEFWLSISVYREPVSEDFNIKGTIRSGGAREYRLHFAGDLSVPIKIDTLGSK